MQGHRRRRATQRSPATPISPTGGGGAASISLSLLLHDAQTSRRRRFVNSTPSRSPQMSRCSWDKTLGITIGILFLVGCSGAVKKRTQVSTPLAYASAQVASLDELVRMINERYAVAKTLSVSSVKVEFVGGSLETGVIEEYRSAKAYLVAKRPDSIYLNILNPLTSSTVVAMAAAGETFQIWIPGENKYLTGRADVEVEEENPILNVRPQHLLEGLLVERIPVDSLRYRYFLEETEDPRFKYYVVVVIEVAETSRAVRLMRKLWIERSSMHLVRQQYYDSGERISSITYDHTSEIAGVLIPSDIEIERKREDYRIALELAQESIKVNQSVREGAFDVPVPPGAELIQVEGESGDTEKLLGGKLNPSR